MFLVGQVSWLFENIYTGISSYTINVINVKLCIMVLVKLCMMVLFIELYLFIPFSLTLTIIQGHSLSLIHI